MIVKILIFIFNLLVLDNITFITTCNKDKFDYKYDAI